MKKNFKGLISIIALACCIHFFSCEKSIAKRNITGLWVIDTLIYKGNNIKYCLGNNAISFDKTGACTVPEVIRFNCTSDSITNRRNGTYLFSEMPSQEHKLELNWVTSIFKGNHNLYFINNTQRQVLMAKIYSDSLYMVVSKMLVNYTQQELMIRQIAKETR
ncbi:MAG: hypothetical protein MUC87_19325 [Bacteroidia bacterium]|jgi:hypothetical protein|nr:hypothetical protein [Bacteroidia bacterium]